MDKDLVSKLSSVENKLRELKLDKVADDIKRVKFSYSNLKEMHDVPSVEKIYENSKSLADFSRGLKRIIDIFERYLDKLKNFEVEFNKILTKVEAKNLSEKDAIIEIVDRVTKIDEFFDNELKKL